MNNKQLDVVEAYLCRGWSHRKIQQDILKMAAPVRGGGYEAMSVLHSFGITSEYKGILRGQYFDRNRFLEKRSIRRYLDSLRVDTSGEVLNNCVKSQANTSAMDISTKEEIMTNEDEFEVLLKEVGCEYEKILQDNVSFFKLYINSESEAGTIVLAVVFFGDEVIITARGFIEDVRQEDHIILKHINKINISQPFVCFSYDDKKISSNMYLPFADSFCPKITMNGVLKTVVAISNEYRGLMKVIWS